MCKSSICAVMFFVCFLSSQLQARTLDVNKQDPTCNDQTGQPFCSVSSAIQSAKPNEVINIGAGSYLESIIIDKDLKLVGINPENTLIDSSRQSSVVIVEPGVRVQLKSLTLQNGRANKGGGILNKGALMLDNVRVIDNIAELSGGGIYNASSISGSLFIKNSIIEHNQSVGNDKRNIKYGGGGIYNNAPLIMENVKLSFNQAVDNGGGLYSIFSGRSTFTDGEIMAEKLGIGSGTHRQPTLKRKQDVGAVSIKQSVISYNHADAGAGINVHGVLNISETSISDNFATNGAHSSGGGLFAHFDTTLNMSNVLINFNKATFRGGGVRFYTVGAGKFFNVSIIDNEVLQSFGQGAGIFIIQGGKTLEIVNSLIARNYIEKQFVDDCYGSFKSLGNNYFSSINNCKGYDVGKDIYHELVGVDYLYQWDEHVGKYKIHSLSQHVENGNIGGCLDEKSERLNKDIYGEMRHIDADGDGISRCDIGAIEFKP